MWIRTIVSFVPERWKFEWLYWRQQTPWDTQITPPEVWEFIARRPPGRALDLGCGTGTNAITLARKGWQVTGVDFAKHAIGLARKKAAAAGLSIDFRVGDVTDLRMLDGPYEYALDIGCLFGLRASDRMRYAKELARLVRPGGDYMLYAWLPRPWKGRLCGMSSEEVDTLLEDNFERDRIVVGEEKGFPSAWHWYRRR